MQGANNAVVQFKPFLMYAFVNWCNARYAKPYLHVKTAGAKGLPPNLMAQPEIMLNIGASASSDLNIIQDGVEFTARFNTIPHKIFIPMANVNGLVDMSSGNGYGFHPTKDIFEVNNEGHIGDEVHADQENVEEVAVDNKPDLKVVWVNPNKIERDKNGKTDHLKLIK